MSEPRSTAAAVDDILATLAEPGCDVDVERQRLEDLGASAVARLLERLGDPDTDASLVLYALQFCWNAEAIEPVAALLAHRDLECRRMAAILLDRHHGREYIAKRAARYIDHPDPAVAGFCFEHAEQVHPDPRRVAHALATPALQARQARYLSSYYDPALAGATRRLLAADDPELVRAGLIGLIHHDDHEPGSKAGIIACLGHSAAQCREAAAEYLAWHGAAEQIPALRSAAGDERDGYARAALLDAMAAIRRRGERNLESSTHRCSRGPAPISDPGAHPVETRDAPGGATPEPVNAEDDTELVEPRWLYSGHAAAPEFSRLRDSRIRRLARIHGFPWIAGSDPEESPGNPVPPLAAALVAPTRHTFTGTERSYGVQTKSDDRAFKALAHVGDDVGWYRDHDTVVSIADGVVRAVRFEPTWGYLVIVEHRLDGQRYPALAEAALPFADTISEPVVDDAVYLCSLYGHLGQFVRARPGARVERGEKIGTIGRTFSYENGGYPAHLHFGLHLGPYRQSPHPRTYVDVNFRGARYRGRVVSASAGGIEATIRYRGDPEYPVTRTPRWECGYIARWYWESQRHGWLDPRAWLRHFGADPSVDQAAER